MYAVGVWLVFLVLAIINGIIRNSVYAPKLSEHKGHVISSLIAVAYTLAITYLFVNSISSTVTLADLLMVGAFWLTITVIFEFGFGHYIIGHSWSHLIADYNIIKGRLWSVVLLTTFAAPTFWGIILGLN
ncbi:MAG: hypothetical protein CW691_08025 [Candidatus Bathyarchaeum sp.]|nr:MAG: hypothetical protein CW691_08025 [Candidatus Bathyarchaeum sp.]